MSGLCREMAGRLPELAQDALPETERRALRSHLASCAACRREAVAGDPVLAFSRFAPEDVSEAEVADVLAGVRHAVALRRAESRLKPRARRPSLAAAASAAAALAAVLLLPGGPSSAPPIGAGASGVEPAAAVVAPARSTSDFTDSGATVYDWNTGGGEPRVVWIVDRSLDI